MRPWSRLMLGAGAVAATLTGGRPAAALDLPETSISYRIEAELDPETRALRGTEEIRWKNVTGETISALPLHLYLNAFSHSRTTWMEEVAPGRLLSGDLLTREPDPWGYIDTTKVTQRVAEGELEAAARPVQPDDGNALDRSLAEITLPSPVPPGGEVTLTIAFEGKMPVPIARTGGARDFYLVSQWYPKIGVIEPPGVRGATRARSAARQFHEPTEFYADFADYDVTFKVPDGWLLGATGRAEGEPAAGGGRLAYHYKQRAVHDFAIVTGSALKAETARYTPKGGGPPVDVKLVVVAGTEHQIPRWRASVEGALDVLGSRVGPYPYGTLTVVLMPSWADRTSGMEYPTLITGLPADRIWDTSLLGPFRIAENVIVHELGHQYFYGMLASSEQDEAFLDEGFNSYWEDEITRTLHGDDASWGHLLGRRVLGSDARAMGLESSMEDIREPVRRKPAWLFAPGTWGEQVYDRSAVTFATAAALFGQERVDRVFANYFQRFAFRHPDADDFLAVADEAGGPDVAAFLRESFERERIPDFSVAKLSVSAYEAPIGRVMTESGPVTVTRETRAKTPELGLPPEAREADGQVQMEITDPGWARGGQSQMGTITKVLIAPQNGEPRADHKAGSFHESSVRIEGPAWDNLPVDVELRFADGAIVRDRWDGKAAWRGYRFIRPAPLVEARIDPAGRLALDVKPQNDALSDEADSGFAVDWALWLGAVSQWLAGGLSQWL